jgi:hypothetical protein
MMLQLKKSSLFKNLHELLRRPKVCLFVKIAGYVVALDVVTKVLALLFVPIEPMKILFSSIILRKVINVGFIGTQLKRNLVDAELSSNFLLFQGGLLVIFVATIGHRYTINEKAYKKVLLTIGILVLAQFVAVILSNLWHHPIVSNWTIQVVYGFGLLSLNFFILRILNNKSLFVVFSIGTAGSLGNFLNLFYYPSGIIDFIYIRAIKRWFCTTNIADLSTMFSSVTLPIIAIIMALSYLLSRYFKVRSDNVIHRVLKPFMTTFGEVVEKPGIRHNC